MRRPINTIATAIFICLSLGMGLSVSAHAADAVKIGYVDLQAVINLSKAGKKEQDKIKEFIKKRQKEIAAEEKKLDALGKKFEKDRLTMSKEQQKKKQEVFKKKLMAFRKLTRQSENEVKKKESLFTKRALAELKIIVADIAKDKGFTFIVEKSEGAVLYSQEGMDITDYVMEDFDKKFGK